MAGALLSVSGCHDQPKPFNTGWNLPFWNAHQKVLYVQVGESTLDRGSVCFLAYDMSARWTGKEFDITAMASYPNYASNTACNDLGVEAWAVVHLPHPYSGQPLRDTVNGRVHETVPSRHPTPDQIVG